MWCFAVYMTVYWRCWKGESLFWPTRYIPRIRAKTCTFSTKISFCCSAYKIAAINNTIRLNLWQQPDAAIRQLEDDDAITIQVSMTEPQLH